MRYSKQWYSNQNISIAYQISSAATSITHFFPSFTKHINSKVVKESDRVPNKQADNSPFPTRSCPADIVTCFTVNYTGYVQ